MRVVTMSAVVLMAVSPLVGVAAPDGVKATLNAKRQIIDCMNKRMAASRTLSYYDAARMCKDQTSQLLAQQTAVSASATPVKSVSAP